MKSLSLALAAVLVAIVVLAAVAAGAATREGLAVSPRARAVHKKAAALFGRGDATYGAFRRAIPDADPVMHSDAWRLYRLGSLTPAAVQRSVLP